MPISRSAATRAVLSRSKVALLAWAVSAWLMAPAPATAQSRYTLTTLGKAWGANPAEVVGPQWMGEDGTVMGGVNQAYYLASDPSISCYFCTLWGIKEATWTGTGATATRTLGAARVRAYHRPSDNSLVLGELETGRVRDGAISAPFYAADPQLSTLIDMNTGIAGNRFVTHKVGSTTLTEVTLPAALAGLESAIVMQNRSGTAVGRGGSPAAPTALVRQGGNWTVLPGAAPSETVYSSEAVHIDDAGVITGNLRGVDDAAYRTPGAYLPVRWVNGQMQPLGGEALRGWRVKQVNAQGQVLLTASQYSDELGDIVRRSAIWLNGQLTVLPGPEQGSVQATAMNDNGDVAYCTQPTAPSLNQTVDTIQVYIWRRGTATELRSWLSARGLNTPANWVWLCPMAMNKAGSLLTSYLDMGAQVRQWVRLNGLP